MQHELVRAMATIADLKEENYRLWLGLSAVIEALSRHGLVEKTELQQLAAELAAADAAAITAVTPPPGALPHGDGVTAADAPFASP